VISRSWSRRRFHIVSPWVMVVKDKRRDIAHLRTFQIARRAASCRFIVQGSLIGGSRRRGRTSGSGADRGKICSGCGHAWSIFSLQNPRCAGVFHERLPAMCNWADLVQIAGCVRPGVHLDHYPDLASAPLAAAGVLRKIEGFTHCMQNSNNIVLPGYGPREGRHPGCGEARVRAARRSRCARASASRCRRLRLRQDARCVSCSAASDLPRTGAPSRSPAPR